MKGKTALVTGAGRRIGAVIVRTLHAVGMNVVIHYHQSSTDAKKLSAALNAERAGSASIFQADLVNRETYGPLVEAACEFGGGLDVLVNNASAFYPTTIGSTTYEQWEEIIATNLTAPFFLAQHAAPALRRHGGCIINITDIHAARPLKEHAVYSTAKAGLEMLTRALAKDLGPDIRVNGVAPGAILWPGGMSDDLKGRIISHTMLKRVGTPDDISAAVRFLVLEANYMTGQVLTVDGGRTLYS